MAFLSSFDLLPQLQEKEEKLARLEALKKLKETKPEKFKVKFCLGFPYGQKKLEEEGLRSMNELNKTINELNMTLKKGEINLEDEVCLLSNLQASDTDRLFPFGYSW